VSEDNGATSDVFACETRPLQIEKVYTTNSFRM
jgi:hypothetical protein